MIKRKITNKVTYKEKIADNNTLTDSEYNKKVYFLGIKVMEHTYNETQFGYEKGVTTDKSIGFTKPNKNT